MFHLRPRAVSVGSFSKSKFTTDFALSDSGIAARTSLSLLCHFVKRKPPLQVAAEVVYLDNCFLCDARRLHHIVFQRLHCFSLISFSVHLCGLPQTEISNTW